MTSSIFQASVLLAAFGYLVFEEGGWAVAPRVRLCSGDHQERTSPLTSHLHPRCWRELHKVDCKHWQILTEVKVTVGPFSLNLLRNDWLAGQRDSQPDLHKQHRPFLKLSFKTSNSFYHPLVSLQNLSLYQLPYSYSYFLS